MSRSPIDVLRIVAGNSWVRCLCLFLVVYPFVKYGWVEPLADRYVGFDFEIFYRAAEDLTAGNSPYSREVFYSDSPPLPDEVAGVYIYPAFFARILTPLTFLSPFRAKLVFVVLTCACVFWLLIPTFREISIGIRPGGSFWVPIFIPAAFLFSWGPLIENLRYGQSNLLTLAFFCGAWRVAVDRSRSATSRDFTVGFLIGLAGLIKLTPLVILPILLVAGYGWVLLGACGGILLALLLSGWAATREYFLHILPVVLRLENSPRGIGLSAILDRHSPDPVGREVLMVLFLVLLVWTFKTRPKVPLARCVLLGAYLPTVFAGLWYHHYLLALLPLTVCVPERLAHLGSVCCKKASPLVILQTVLLLLLILPGFYYWLPVRKTLIAMEGVLPFSSSEIFVIGHVIVFLMLLPTMMGKNERSR